MWKLLEKMTSAGVITALLFVTAGVEGTPAAHASEYREQFAKYYGADLRDWAPVTRRNFPLLGHLNQYVTNHRSRLFPEGSAPLARRRSRGLARPDKENRRSVVMGIQLADLSEPTAEGTGEATLWLAYTERYHLKFRKVVIELRRYTGHSGIPRAFRFIGDEVPARRVEFKIQSDIAKRQTLLESTSHPGLRRVFPNAVAMFDPGVTQSSGGRLRLVVPEFHEAFLRKEDAVSSANGDYEERPFLPISSIRQGRYLPGTMNLHGIAYHLVPKNERLERGFVSNACFRMRESDIYELYSWLKYGKLEQVPVQVLLHTNQDVEHPYPLMNTRYKEVRNCAPEGEPAHECRDDTPGHPLREARWVRGVPPIDRVEMLNGATLSEQNEHDYTRPLPDVFEPSEELPQIPGTPDFEREQREQDDSQLRAV